MKGGKYNFLIKKTSNKNNVSFIPSDFPLIFVDSTNDTFEKIYNYLKFTLNKPSKPFIFEKDNLGQSYVLFNKDGQVYLQKLDKENTIFTIEPIISPAEYFFGKTALDRIDGLGLNTFNQNYSEWEKELLESIRKNKITPEDIHKFLFMKNINMNKIKNKNSYNQHMRKLNNKKSNYYDYLRLQERVPRIFLHYYGKFFKKHPEYDLRS
jgi:hypothetical protein